MFKNKSVQKVVNRVMGRISPVGGYAVKSGVNGTATMTKAVGSPSNAGKKEALLNRKKRKVSTSTF